MQTDKNFSREGISLKKAAAGVAVFFFAILLLDATSLEENARNMEFGAGRDFCVKVIAPVSKVSRICRFHCVRAVGSYFRSRFMDQEN